MGFGVAAENQEEKEDNDLAGDLWGTMDSASEDSDSSEEEEEENEDENIDGIQTPAESGMVTPSGISSVPSGMETPHAGAEEEEDGGGEYRRRGTPAVVPDTAGEAGQHPGPRHDGKLPRVRHESGTSCSSGGAIKRRADRRRGSCAITRRTDQVGRGRTDGQGTDLNQVRSADTEPQREQGSRRRLLRSRCGSHGQAEEKKERCRHWKIRIEETQEFQILKIISFQLYFV